MPLLAGLDLHPGMVLPLALKWTFPATELVAALRVLVLLKIRLVPVVKVRVALVRAEEIEKVTELPEVALS